MCPILTIPLLTAQSILDGAGVDNQTRPKHLYTIRGGVGAARLRNGPDGHIVGLGMANQISEQRLSLLRVAFDLVWYTELN